MSIPDDCEDGLSPRGFSQLICLQAVYPQRVVPLEGLGNGAAATIVAAREDQPFDSVGDLWQYARVPTISLEQFAESARSSTLLRKGCSISPTTLPASVIEARRRLRIRPLNRPGKPWPQQLGCLARARDDRPQ